MTQDIKTLELAKTYESQGYYEDALKVYSFLNDQETTSEISAGIKRMENKMTDDVTGSHSEKNISQLFEKWLKLMILEQRLDHFKRIKSQLL